MDIILNITIWSINHTAMQSIKHVRLFISGFLSLAGIVINMSRACITTLTQPRDLNTAKAVITEWELHKYAQVIKSLTVNQYMPMNLDVSSTTVRRINGNTWNCGYLVLPYACIIAVSYLSRQLSTFLLLSNTHDSDIFKCSCVDSSWNKTVEFSWSLRVFTKREKQKQVFM